MGIETQTINGTVTQIINSSETDIASYIGIGIAAITAFFLWRQIRKQSRVDSARFTIDYIDKVLEKNKDVIDIIYKRENDNRIKFNSDKSVRILLNQLEDIIQFKNDKIIQKKHILNTLGILLRTIKKDVDIKRIMKEAQQKDKSTFELLEDFFDKETS